jgi:DNA repair protein RadC
MNYNYLFAAVFLAAFFAPAMEKKRSAPEAGTIAKRTKYQDLSGVEKLPRDLQIKIIVEIVRNSPTARDAFNELNKIQALSTHFYNLLNSKETVTALVYALAKRFYHYDAIKAAQLWNTRAAREWMQTVLPSSAQEKIEKILQNKIITIIDGNFEPIINELNRPYNGGTLKDIFNPDYAKIWLITFIMQSTSGLRKFTLQELADALFAEETRSPELQEWLKFAESSLMARLPDSLKYLSREKVQKFARQEIDITLNLSNHFPALFHAVDPNIIELLLQSGASVNQKDRMYGHTMLHYLILYELQNSSEKNQRVYAAIEKLLTNGANPNIKNGRGKTVLDVAREKQAKLNQSGSAQDPFFERLIELLKKYGAR